MKPLRIEDYIRPQKVIPIGHYIPEPEQSEEEKPKPLLVIGTTGLFFFFGWLCVQIFFTWLGY